MATIPASAIVSVLPSVEGATGNSLVLNGVMLTTTARIPVGTVQSFASALAVGAYFGLGSTEYAQAQIYFAGFNSSTQTPQSLLVAQFTPADVPAFVRGGVFNTLTIPQVQGISGTLAAIIDGYTYSASALNLASATSYSAAAALIQTALNATLPAGAVSSATGGVIATVTSTFTGSISGNVLTVTSAPTNVVVPGAILTATGVTAGTMVTAQLSGSAGGIGTYAVSAYQTVGSVSISGTYGVLTITGANASGTFSVNQTLSGGTVAAGTKITALGTGSGGAGTYYVTPSQTVSAATVTATGSALTVTFDSVSGGLVIKSGALIGASSTAAYATGTAAASLFLTAQAGAVLSQGISGQTPSAFMSSLVTVTQNWATFWTVQDPDAGASNGPAQKLAFSAWNNAQNNRYLYIGWDTDATPTTSNAATTSFGYQVNTVYQYSGTCPVYDPNNQGQAAFLAGSIASINFAATNGRTTLAFRSQSGQAATVTNLTVSTNLKANGYNWYGAYATANQAFQFFYPGSVSGPFLWLDSYANQIYMNQQFQLDLMELLVQVNSIPYTSVGYALVEAAILSTINQMVNFGAIRSGVTLSTLEVAEVNAQAGYAIDSVLYSQGWFLQVQPATTSTRQARSTPVCLFFYCDGQSIQQLTLNSIELL